MGHDAGRLRRALDHQYAAAVTLSTGALLALVWSALSLPGYRRLVATPWFHGHDTGLHSVILNGAMTFFFAAVGLELSREWRASGFRRARASLAPILGAMGGMGGAAVLSLIVGDVISSSALKRGWGVPMATDVAFTLAALTLAGPRVPRELRLFLLTLAIADDVMSVIVLAVTGASHMRPLGIVAIGVLAGLAKTLGRRQRPVAAFALLIVPLWLSFAWAGIDPALSGVLAGAVTPVNTGATRKLESVVTRCSVGAVLPLFALVACGVAWTSLSVTGTTGKVIFGTIVVRLLGKVLGVSLGVFIAERCGARRPPRLTVPILVGATLLCATGFTVPLLFAAALFNPLSATYGAFTIGLLAASVLGAGGGISLLRRATR